MSGVVWLGCIGVCTRRSRSVSSGFDPQCHRYFADARRADRRSLPARMAPKKKPPAAAAPLKAQGTGGHKRTPTSAFDSAAGKDVYELEKVITQRLAKGVTQYQVKWKNYENKHNTWEPIENLAGAGART